MNSRWIAGVVLGAGALLGCEGSTEMTIEQVDPRAGDLQGEQTVKIIGQNFRQDIGYTIFFGTERSPNVAILSPELLVAVTPRMESAQTVDLTIRADDGNAFRVRNAFRYENMRGSVMEGVGAPGAGGEATKKGNLAY